MQKKRKWGLKMNIIKHRRNNPYNLKKNDLVEIDVRKHLDLIYVTHDPITNLCLPTLDDYLRIAARKELFLVAVDMKENGLEEKVLKSLDRFDVPGFIFADANLKKYDLDLKYRYNNRVPIVIDENNPFLQSFEPKEWIWLHTNEKDIDFLKGQYEKIRKKSPYVGICFSGVNTMRKKELNNLLYNVRKDNNTYICTDYWGDFNDRI